MADHGLCGMNVHLSKEKPAQLLERGRIPVIVTTCVLVYVESGSYVSVNYIVPSVNMSFNVCESTLHNEKLHQHRKHFSAQVNMARHPRTHRLLRVLKRRLQLASPRIFSLQFSFHIKKRHTRKPHHKIKTS